jgi:hypothetical protein
MKKPSTDKAYYKSLIFFLAALLSAFVLPEIISGCRLCLAVERISDDVSDSSDLIDAQNFGSLNLETGEVTVTPGAPKPPAAGNETHVPPAAPALAPAPVPQPARVTAEVSAIPPSATKTDEIDLISQLVPEETYEIIGSSAAANPVAEEHFKVGTDLFNRKEYILAKAHFEKAIKLEANNDVYLLALEMVVNTMRAQGITEPARKPEAVVDVKAPENQQVTTTASSPPADGKGPGPQAQTPPDKSATQAVAIVDKKRAAPPARPVVKTQVLTCYFEERLPVGNIIFNTGVNTDIKRSDIDGYYVLFDNEKESLALAAFRLDHEPKKAMLIVTQKLFADDNNFVFPLTIKVNNFETLNGAFRLATEFRPYQFDITGRLHRGFNQVLFQCAPFNTANFALLRVEIFIQNY